MNSLLASRGAIAWLRLSYYLHYYLFVDSSGPYVGPESGINIGF